MSSIRLAGLLAVLVGLGWGGWGPVVHAQIDMPPRSLNHVTAEAQAKGTPILVEVYAPWCPYCARMQEEVYADSTVRTYLSRHFTYARLNSATADGSHRYRNRVLSSEELATAFGTRGVPNTVFLKPDGTPIARQPGFLDRSTFLQLIRYVGSGAYEEQPFEEFADEYSE